MLLCRRFNAVSSQWLSTSTVRCWRNFENERHYEPGEELIKRVKHGLTYDFRRASRRYKEAKYDAFRRLYPIAHMKRETQDYEVLPYRADFVIIGGGLTGSATAYWLKQGFRDESLSVVVVESTENFAKSRSMLGSGVVSQQFSNPEFVEMALFSAEFLRHAGEHLQILDNDPPDINLLPVGFLHLASNEEESEKLRQAWKVQVEKGAHVAFLQNDELRSRFPFMNFEGIVSGSYGLENEGVFDTWQLLSALREKNITLGVQYVKGKVEGFDFTHQKWEAQDLGFKDEQEAERLIPHKSRLTGAFVRPQMTGASARPIRCYQMINAAGPWAGEVAQMAGIGKGEGLMSVPLPIVCKRRTNFVIHAPEVPALKMPALVDSSGIFCRPDNVGFNYICGKNPTKKDIVSKDSTNEEVDYDSFYDEVLPHLVKRVPAFNNAKVINAWNMYEDVNTFDNAPILGEHLVYDNFYQMCGIGGFGSQLSLAIGKLYVERAYNQAYTTVNVRPFDMRRIMHGKRENESLRCA